MKPLIFLTYSVIKKGIINNYFFNLLLKNFFRASRNDFRASRCWLQLARRASCKMNFLCTLLRGPIFKKFSGGACPRTPPEARALRALVIHPPATLQYWLTTSKPLENTGTCSCLAHKALGNTCISDCQTIFPRSSDSVVDKRTKNNLFGSG